jgi:hypothetical protein
MRPPASDSFPGADGGYLNFEHWRYTVWSPAIDASGIGLFDLSRFMGTSIEMIDTTYGHLAAGSEQAALAKLDALDG